MRIRTGETDKAAVTPVGALMDARSRSPRSTRGDTAWMLIATALVLMMTPALGLFYAGLVRSKNTLNTFMMCVAAIAVAVVTWAAVGYSLAFDEGNGIIGGFDYAFLNDVAFEPREGGTIPHLLFFAFQATFCIITTALVSGAVVERMRFGAFLVFAALWSVLVYAVLAHWGFGPGWLLNGGTLDFAGGIPVEMASGFSALAAALVVGARKDYGRQALLPHNAVYVLLGAGLLWFGWFGFNGGSGFNTGAELDPRVHQHAADPGLHAAGLVRARRDPRPPGDRDRRRDRDHRRLRRDHPRRRLHQPRATRCCSAPWSRFPCYAVIVWRTRTRVDETLDVLAAHGVAGLHRDPVHRLLRPGLLERDLRRGPVRQRRPARRPGARGRRRARLRLRDDLRAAARDRRADARCARPRRRRRRAWT